MIIFVRTDESEFIYVSQARLTMKDGQEHGGDSILSRQRQTEADFT